MSKGELRLWLIVFAILAVLLLTALSEPARAEGAYVEASATRIQSYVQTLGVTERLVQQEGFWGAEVFGRLPVRDRFALIARAYSEGAAGSHSWRDPSTWRRAVGELAVSGEVFRFALDAMPDRYAVGIMGGAGLSWQLKRGSYTQMVPDEENELDGAPPKFGVGVHLRDSKLGAWLNVRAEWDAAVGPGVHLAGTLHVPVFGERGGFGVDVVYGDNAKVNILAKVRLFRWGGE